MERANILCLPGPACEADGLEDISLHRLTLDHYDREHVSLRRYLSLLGVESETSREIVQECFLKLHEHLLRGGDRSNLRAWLYRVAHNLARNAQTAFRNSRTDSLPDITVSSDLPAKIESPEEKLLSEERLGLFRQAIDQLSAQQRECLILRAQGFKYREIAEILKLSISTVGENAQRGLERLKELL